MSRPLSCFVALLIGFSNLTKATGEEEPKGTSVEVQPAVVPKVETNVASGGTPKSTVVAPLLYDHGLESPLTYVQNEIRTLNANMKKYRAGLSKLLAKKGKPGTNDKEDVLNNRAHRLMVSLDVPPPVRVRVSMDSDNGRHAELDFDPAQSLNLTKYLMIPPRDRTGKEQWYVSVTSDRLVYSNSIAEPRAELVDFNPPRLPVTQIEDGVISVTQCYARQISDITNSLITPFKGKIISKIDLTQQKPKANLWNMQIIGLVNVISNDGKTIRLGSGFREAINSISEFCEIYSYTSDGNSIAYDPMIKKGIEDTCKDAILIQAKSIIDTPWDDNLDEQRINIAINSLESATKKLSEWIKYISAAVKTLNDNAKNFSRFNSCSLEQMPLSIVANIPGNGTEPKRLFEISFSTNRDMSLSFRSSIEKLSAFETNRSMNRSLSNDMSSVAADAVQLLTQIAVNRAKRQGFEFLRKRLLTELDCVRDLNRADSKQETYLPQTCEVIQALRLEDLASSGLPLLQSLTSDLLSHSIKDLLLVDLRDLFANQNTPSDPTLRLLNDGISQAMQIAQTAALGKVQLSSRDLQLLLISFAKMALAKSTEKVTPELCQVQLMFAIMSECTRPGGCELSLIADMAKSPSVYFENETGGCEPGNMSTGNVPPKFLQLVSSGLEVLSPARTTSVQAQLRHSLLVIFGTAELLSAPPVAPTQGVPARAEDANRATTEKCGREVLRLGIGSISTLVLALVDHDTAGALAGLGRLLHLPGQATAKGCGEVFAKADPNSDLVYWRKQSDRLSRALKILAPIGSYVQNINLDEKADAKTAEAQREARQRAIESLIDAATSRTERRGDWIASLGIMPGFSMIGGQLGPGTEPTSSETAHESSVYYYTQLTLPFGIALQKLPSLHSASCMGLHMQISVLDLAQFVSFDANQNKAFDNIKWAEFVSIGTQIGFLLGQSPNALFFLGGEVRYMPAVTFAEDSKRGVFRAGLLFGYYVPIFDFN